MNKNTREEENQVGEEEAILEVEEEGFKGETILLRKRERTNTLKMNPAIEALSKVGDLIIVEEEEMVEEGEAMYSLKNVSHVTKQDINPLGALKSLETILG